MEKPPVLSEEEIEKWCSEHKAGKGGLCYVANSCEICKRRIQRDKDAEWYEKKYLIPDYEYNLQQARQDTAREIFEEIEKMELPQSHVKMPIDHYDDEIMDEIITFEYGARKYRHKVLALKSKFLIPPNPVGAGDV